MWPNFSAVMLLVLTSLAESQASALPPRREPQRNQHHIVSRSPGRREFLFKSGTIEGDSTLVSEDEDLSSNGLFNGHSIVSRSPGGREILFKSTHASDDLSSLHAHSDGHNIVRRSPGRREFLFKSGTLGDAPTPAIEGDEDLSSSHALSHGHFEFSLEMYGALSRESESRSNLAFSPVVVADSLVSFLLSADVRQDERRLEDEGDLLTRETNGEPVPGVKSSISESIRDVLIAEELKKVLHFGNLSRNLLSRVHQSLRDCLKTPYYQKTLNSCTRNFCQQPAEIEDFFFEKVVSLDFKSNSSGAMKAINRWVSNCTGGQVSSLLQQPPARDTRHLVAGGGVFSTNWRQSFDTSLTFEKGLFYTDGQRLEIPVMVGRQLVPLGYSRSLETRVLELPFAERRASLFLLLPDHPHQGLSSLESNLTVDTVRSLLATLQDEIVNIRLPRFTVESSPPLAAALRNLGVNELFSEATGSESESPQLLLTDFIYRMIVEVQERSKLPITTGDDPSRAEVPSSSTHDHAQPMPYVGTFGEKHFQVDHPFVFFVWDYIRSYVVCMGRVVHPSPIPNSALITEDSFDEPSR